jgi:hypothetical protein
MNLTNRTELFVNFNRAELELKKIVRIKLEFRAEPIPIELSRTQTSSTQLDSFPALFKRKIKKKEIHYCKKRKKYIKQE